MSKKRVHEIAKELKNAGIELDNKEVVTELVSLGYDVKSHSSSLDDDQATAAVQKIIEKRKPKAPVAPVAAKGFVVRRKIGEEAPRPVETREAPAQHVETRQPEAAPVQEAPAAERAEPEAQPEQQPAAAEAPVAAQPAATAATQPAAQTPAVTQPAATQRPEATHTVANTPPTPPAARPPEVRQQPMAAQPQHRYAPGFQPRAQGAVTIRPGSQIRPTGHAAQGHGNPNPAQAAGAPGAPAPQVDTRNLRPTATQAVVISRPLIQVRRVTPASNAHKNIPAAPGRKAIGEVRELKVVPDGFGRGKDFVDVTKNKDQRSKRRTDTKDGVAPSKQEITDLIWGRVSVPLRGKKKKPTKKGQKTQITEMASDKKVIKIQEGISVSDFAQRMGVKVSEIIKKLMAGGNMATANQMIDKDTAEIIATDYGWKVEKVGFEVEDNIPEVEDKDEDNVGRPPVVTVMGHVDHGKTSLLDAIRQANVAAGEAGGITQHIGAYTVSTDAGDITFLDTPGHEAFSAMRSRGADVTDIVILVVAADDGVMPQTKEAIQHAKNAEVPIVVAINKMDVPGANPDRVKKELADAGLLPEDWGGETQMVPVSAKQKTGLELLLENVLLQAEVLELKANPTLPAVGAIIEAKLEKGRGPVASVLVQEGTLRMGDAVVVGNFYGRVRLLVDDLGNHVEEVKPGYSAEVIGLSGVPSAGDTMNAVADERAAKEIAEHREFKQRQSVMNKTSKD
ncbi:MAG: translation initiation factor IF-2, partial [Myxococcaceae bacterium]